MFDPPFPIDDAPPSPPRKSSSSDSATKKTQVGQTKLVRGLSYVASSDADDEELDNDLQDRNLMIPSHSSPLKSDSTSFFVGSAPAGSLLHQHQHHPHSLDDVRLNPSSSSSLIRSKLGGNSPQGSPQLQVPLSSSTVHLSLSSSPLVLPRSFDQPEPSSVPAPSDKPAGRRRTVSDAAQWMRRRRHSDLQREVLLAGTNGAPKHEFDWVSVSKPTFCAVCSKIFWGFSKQGMKCRACGLEAHAQCQHLAPACLGLNGSLASLHQASLPYTEEPRLIRLTIVSAENLSRRSVFRLADPFCIVKVDDEQFQTSVAKKTLNPEWNTSKDIYVTSSTTLTVYVLDSKKYVPGVWEGFLGMCVIPVSLFLESNLGEDATIVLPFRLKKKNPDDVVTGNILVSSQTLTPPARLLSFTNHLPSSTNIVSPLIDASKLLIHPSLPSPSSPPTTIPPSSSSSSSSPFRKNKSAPPPSSFSSSSPLPLHSSPNYGGSPSSSRIAKKGTKNKSASPLTVTSTSPVLIPRSPRSPIIFKNPGVQWNPISPSSPPSSLVPGRPSPPQCVLMADNEPPSIHVSWGLPEKGLCFTLAVLTNRDSIPQDLFTGEAAEYVASGFVGGDTLRFLVKASNLFASSAYSDPSDPISIPVNTKQEKEQRHCPMFMAGFCFRGSSCPFSHGSGLQSADDVAAALFAVSFLDNPDLHMAAAIAASLNDYTRDEFDATKLPAYKRRFHDKAASLRHKLVVENGECLLTIARGDLFKSSYIEVLSHTPAELKRRLAVRFSGEGGLDYGGLAREWFYIVSHEVFHPKHGMFVYNRKDDYALQIDPTSGTDPDHLLYFFFVGRVLGLAVLHGHFLDVSFTLVFFKLFLGKHVSLRDLQVVDPQYHESLLWILQNNVDGVLDLTFTIDYDNFGEIVTKELKPGGAELTVTEENKMEYVRLVLEWKLINGVEHQMNALLYGFHEIVPRELIMDFDERELEFLLCGSKSYDLEDLREHTMFQGGYNEHSSVVKWLWEILASYSYEEQARFFQFCTGSPRVPVEGFQSLQGSDGPRKFCVQKVEDTNRLPSAHTCFNRLDIPPYETREELEVKLKRAVDGAQGFTGD